jgi:acetyl-CoA synthetase (ADP-forming)
MKILEQAASRGAKTLSEHQSKQVLAEYGIPVTRETIARSADEAVRAAGEIGYPVVLKGSGEEISHKTEMNLIALNLPGEAEVREAFARLTAGGAVNEVLVQQMIRGDRELVVGMTRDAQFGPCVMFGLGGIFTEVLQDVAFRVAPLSRRDAREMMDEIRARKILDTFRGKPAVDRELLADILINVGRLGLEQDRIREIDINPLKVPGGKPVAVDALVVLESPVAGR